MRTGFVKSALVVAVMTTAALLTVAPRPARAHCDTLDGPVVEDARAALETGEVSRALKWVTADREAEVRRAFEQSLRVRGLSPEARALADRFFFETVVRVHRDAEGEPYTGLKPAGAPVDPAIRASDAALDSGTVEPLVGLITGRVDRGLRERHARAVEARAHVDDSVELGRRYVAAYVDLMHYAERLLLAAAGPAAPAPSAPHAH